MAIAMQKLADLSGDNYFTEGVVLVGDESTATVQVTHISANTTVPVADDDEGFADMYDGLGKGVGVDFSGFTGDVTVDLNYGDSDTATQRLFSGDTVYESVTAVRASSGENSVILGSSAAETLYAGRNNNTISGGAGRDILYAYDGSDKRAATEFDYAIGYGKDTIYNFETYEGANSVTADSIVIADLDSDSVEMDADIVSGNVRLSFNSSDQLTVVDAENKVLTINQENYAIGDSLTYDQNVTHYLGDDGATITVGDVEIPEGVNIWMNLGGIEGLEDWGDYQDINVLDASDFYYNATLVGSLEDKNVIYGGHGTNSLWGGGFDNDTMVAGEGANEYYYLTNNGNDVIVGAKDDEIVNLLGIDLSNYDINSLVEGIGEDSTEIKFNDGGSIKVNNAASVQFKILGGHKWSVDRSTNTWTYRGQD